MVTKRYMVRGLEPEFLFEQEYVEDVACTDEVAQAILVELYHAENCGVLPKDIAHALRENELNRFQVLRRIQHMNKLLDEEIAQKVAEKHGHKWALTEFTHEAYDKSKEEL